MSVTKVIDAIRRGAYDAVENSKNPLCECILTEHRCSCGRLLGRFNGQAEVKCPKCGKMNVIEGKDNEKDTDII